jgi:hypothetical protein
VAFGLSDRRAPHAGSNLSGSSLLVPLTAQAQLVTDAATVSRFVANLPADYPPHLRAQVLQSSDLLMRAARIRPP